MLARIEKEMRQKVGQIDAVEFKKGQGVLRVCELESCEGYASRCVRKGKVIFVFELKITLAWEGSLMGKDDGADGGVFVKGKVVLPTFSHDDEERPAPDAIVSKSEVTCNVDVSKGDGTTENGSHALADRCIRRQRVLLKKFKASLLPTACATIADCCYGFEI